MDRPHALIRIALGLLVGCAPAVDDPPGAARLVDVISAPGATGEGHRDMSLATDGVRGGGRWQGSLDVFTVGDEELVFAVAEPVRDAEGPELVVFENPFDVAGGGRFMDPAVVEVGVDCDRLVPFPHAYLADDPEVYLADPAAWSGFAGVAPVSWDSDVPGLSPLAAEAGGDRFDLSSLDPDDPAVAELLDLGVGCVRITAATRWNDPRTGLPFPADPISDGPDVDGVYTRVDTGS